MDAQAIIFAILTTGQDKTWLAQETLIADIAGKPLFLLKEKNYSHSGALLSDQEYIEFELPYIETTFVKILEGLREVGCLTSTNEE